MTEPASEKLTEQSAEREGRGSLVGLCAIAASTMIVEVVLTKFLSFKLFHHMTFAVLSLVILSFGASGILSFSNPKLFGLKKGNEWAQLGLFAAQYAIAIGIAIPVFCWCPLNPYDDSISVALRVASAPIIFLIIAVPFFMAGICISQTLAVSRRPVQMIYFWDLAAAAVAALACPSMLSLLGGYGTMAFAIVLALIGAAGYWNVAGNANRVKQGVLMGAGALAAIAVLVYPSWAMKAYGIDILTFKDIGPKVVLRDFKGVAYTKWNPIARVDVSHTGTSQVGTFRYGMSNRYINQPVYGRYVLLDGGANTRQFRMDRDLHEEPFLKDSTWASVYAVKPDAKDVAIMGGGGGLDILVGKAFKIPNLTVIELNPAIYGLLTGTFADPDKRYSRSFDSDQFTKVKILNDEARHFAATQPEGAFDIMQSSGVDTLTAIQTGGMSLTENYLYTVEAIRDYMHMLKPDGVLCLNHWRTFKPGTSLRLFATYLQYLDSIGVQHPEKRVFVMGFDGTVSLLKKSDFTEAELARLRDLAKRCDTPIVFDPGSHTMDSRLYPTEKYYNQIAFASAEERKHLIETEMEIPPPVTDDKPYFYSFRNTTDKWVYLNQTVVPMSLLGFTLVFGLVSLFAPALNVATFKMTWPIFWCTIYFSLAGFAFLLYETVIIQLFGIFVGGPMYSLTVVLVSVLGGYSLGCILANRLALQRKVFLFAAAILGVLFVALYFLIPNITHSLLHLPLPARLAICAVLTVLVTAVIGATVSSAMAVVRQKYQSVVSWMWGVSSVANAIGAVSFISITQQTGISACLLICAACYVLANALFGLLVETE